MSEEPTALTIARNMVQSPDNWPPMRVKQVAEALIASEENQKALAREVYALAEDTATKYEATAKLDNVMGAFSRGRITEAKSIARAIGAIMPYSGEKP